MKTVVFSVAFTLWTLYTIWASYQVFFVYGKVQYAGALALDDKTKQWRPILVNDKGEVVCDK